MREFYYFFTFFFAFRASSMEKPQAEFISFLSNAECQSLATLVNDAYLKGETDICKPSMERTSTAALESLIKKGELIGLRVNGKLEGCIQVGPSPYDDQAALFGMLAIRDERILRGMGYGSLLVEKAESWAKNKGYKIMNLELLKPKDFQQEHKNRLQSWYETRGYQYWYSTNFKCEEELLIKNYDFKIYKKQL